MEFARILRMIPKTPPKLVGYMLEEAFPSGILLTPIQERLLCKLRTDLEDSEIEKYVPHYGYLLGRRWYRENPTLRAKLLRVVRQGLGSRIDCVTADINEQLDNLLLEQGSKFNMMAMHIKNFSYLQSRSWFMRNIGLQNKVYQIVRAGLGSYVDVENDDFDDHLKDIVQYVD